VGALTLVIGNKNYSSWSLRPWLAMRHAGLTFDEVMVPLWTDDHKEKILAHSSSGKVPILKDGDTVVWESLAILEYVADRFPDAGLLPDDPAARAVARSVAAETHAGFPAIRKSMPMNIRKSLPGRGHNDDVTPEIARVCAIWADCRARFGHDGPFLFGRFGVADAMFAPIVARFRTYDVALDAVSAAYCKAVLDIDAFKEWEESARAEPWVIDRVELD